jgi:predicted nucleic acid-binding protein
MIMLDTNVVVAFLNGDKSILKRIRDEIAATAMAHKAALVTADKKHFKNIEGLKLEIWPIK